METTRDPVPGKVLQGWPDILEPVFHPDYGNKASILWPWPGGPWKRLHEYFTGPYLGKMFLVVADAYSRFLEIVPMTYATSTNTITALRRIFSYFDLPYHFVTDNGTQFTTEEF